MLLVARMLTATRSLICAYVLSSFLVVGRRLSLPLQALLLLKVKVCQ